MVFYWVTVLVLMSTMVRYNVIIEEAWVGGYVGPLCIMFANSFESAIIAK